jgi:pimeloyl-ACP methyl ester carboxylesterase
VARFVLIHGAWHGAWCWERLAAELEQRGHDVLAPNLPCDQVGLGIRDYVQLIGPEPEAVVVGHSLGGLTAPLLGGRATVFLAGLVPVEHVYSGLDPSFTGTVRDAEGRSAWPDFETTWAKLYADLDEDDARWAFDRLRPQAGVDPVLDVTLGRCESIVTMRDHVLRPDAQLDWAEQVLGVTPLELDAGHSPYLTHPVELAGLLEWIESR